VVQSLWTSNVSQKVVGLFASIVFARRVGRGIYDDVQLLFAERRRATGKRLATYHRLVPTFAARFNGLDSEASAAAAVAGHSRWATWVLFISLPIGVALAGVGYYVLAYIATGKA
jgi:ABC-type molybdate transport system permease subunit